MKRKIAVVLALCLLITVSFTNSNSFAVVGSWKFDSSGWWYEYSDGSYAMGWTEIDGYWYYFLGNGYMDYSEYRDGCWLNADGTWNTAYSGGYWASDSTGWWYKYPDGSYPKNQWLEINGTWYYFNGSGYMEYNCYRDHYWLNSDGAYVPGYYGEWKHNEKGYWFDDGGWWPCDRWLKVNGEWYHFNTDEYLDTDTWIGNDYVDEDGKWIKGKVKPTNNGGGGTTTVGGGGTGGNGGSGTVGGGGNGGEKEVVCAHTWIVEQASYSKDRNQVNVDGSTRLHAKCAECERDLTLIADQKMWEKEDFGFTQEEWMNVSSSSIIIARDWHKLKYGCNCKSDGSQTVYPVSTTYPTIYKCSKCGTHKYVPSTGTNIYKMQNGYSFKDSDYKIGTILSSSECEYYNK